jgi:Na+/H+ antiporter NhaD/arsenite permease-like protein
MPPSQPPGRRFGPAVVAYGLVVAAAAVLSAAFGAGSPEGFALFGGRVPFEFVLFVLTLLGVALFHHHTLGVATGGLAAVLAYKLLFVASFDAGSHFLHEWRIVANLLGLLVGFAILAKYFEDSGVPKWIPRILPDRGPWGGFVLLCYVWILSAFLDNIAGAMIGGVIARTVFAGRVTVGFLAAIVAASNAGGAWSVVGDTTTTMMWIDGVPARQVFPAIVASVVALLCFGFTASSAQQRHSPIVVEDRSERVPIDGGRLFVVALILAGAVATNVFLDFPAAGVWGAILVGAFLRKPDWHEVPGAAKGALFLLSLVLCASMMPVKALPDPSWQSAFGLGFVSAVFDNIPLTKLALDQGGYDWGLLAFAVGFGGSMIWFGSSAGVAISKDFPEARNTGRWLREGWFVPGAYVAGFLAMFLAMGWKPVPIPADYDVGDRVAGVSIELVPEGTWDCEHSGGRPTVLLFTDSAGKESFEHIHRLERFSRERLAAGFTALGVLHDTSKERARAAVQEEKFTIPIGCEPGEEVFEHFMQRGEIHTTILDEECRVVYTADGFDERAVDEALEGLKRRR